LFDKFVDGLPSDVRRKRFTELKRNRDTVDNLLDELDGGA
jgi:hypothetical protein